MKKKYIIILGVVAILLIVGISMIFAQKNASTVGQEATVSSQQKTANNTKPVPTLSLPPLTGTAKDATAQFYKYYTSTPQNPLAAGAFNANPYLTSEFKDSIAS